MIGFDPPRVKRIKEVSCSPLDGRIGRRGRERGWETWQVSVVEERGLPLYDVRTEGGRGVPSKADILSNISKGGGVNLRTREGVKKSGNFADVMYGSPQRRRVTKKS